MLIAKQALISRRKKKLKTNLSLIFYTNIWVFSQNWNTCYSIFCISRKKKSCFILSLRKNLTYLHNRLKSNLKYEFDMNIMNTVYSVCNIRFLDLFHSIITVYAIFFEELAKKMNILWAVISLGKNVNKGN